MSMSNKTMLQELCVKRGWAVPKYSTTKQGPDHVPLFSATVDVNGVSFASQGLLSSKKEAEAFAAGIALEKYLGPQTQLPITPKFNSFSSPVKVAHVASQYNYVGRVEENQTWNETNAIQEKKGADELEQLLAKDRELWHREKLQLQMENIELANAIEVKNNEVQQLEKKLEHMKEMATMEQKKTERMISLAEKEQRENEKLHMKVAELEKQLHAKHAVDGDMEVQEINSLSDFKCIGKVLQESGNGDMEVQEINSLSDFKCIGKVFQGSSKALINRTMQIRALQENRPAADLGISTDVSPLAGLRRPREVEEPAEGKKAKHYPVIVPAPRWS